MRPKFQTPTIPKRWKPSQCHPVVYKTQERLVIDIPPYGWGAALFCAILAIVWNSGFWWLGLSNLLQQPIDLFIAFVLLLFWSGGAMMAALVLWALGGCIRLEMDRDNFQLRWLIWNRILHQIQGKTADIGRVDLEVKTVRGRQYTACVFWEKKHKRRLISWRREENEWLVWEVWEFLAQLP